MEIIRPGQRHQKLIPATVGEKAAYARFKEEIVPQMQEKERELFEPRVRGFNSKLIPAPGQNPCAICSKAQYNKLCPEAGNCGPLLYATLWQVHNIDAQKKKLTKKTKKKKTKKAKKAKKT